MKEDGRNSIPIEFPQIQFKEA